MPVMSGVQANSTQFATLVNLAKDLSAATQPQGASQQTETIQKEVAKAFPHLGVAQQKAIVTDVLATAHADHTPAAAPSGVTAGADGAPRPGGAIAAAMIQAHTGNPLGEDAAIRRALPPDGAER